MHNPKLAKVIGPLGAYFRTGYSLSEPEREIAVCIINSKWLSIYPTNAPRALQQGGRLAGRHGRGALVRSVGLVLRQAGFYTRVSMTLAFYDVPAGAIGMAREHANSTRYSISRFYFLAVGIHQSLRVKLPGPLGPHRRRVDTGDAFRPGRDRSSDTRLQGLIRARKRRWSRRPSSGTGLPEWPRDRQRCKLPASMSAYGAPPTSPTTGSCDRLGRYLR